MSDKERLGEIKEARKRILAEEDFQKKCILLSSFEELGYLDFLIEQAERVQELEKQNKRYRKALEEIRDIGIRGRIISTGEIIRSKEANLAEEALEGEE